jgi:organic hydroperoxide reductase OsmC/OhrA
MIAGVSNTKTFTYEVSVDWDRDLASSLSTAGRPTILSGPPDDFPLGEADRWSPEQLFLGALASCTMISFLAHADHKGVEVRNYTARIDGTVMRRLEDGRYAFVHVHQRPLVVVATGHAEQARELIGKAERDCFISASTSAEVQNDWEIVEES